MNNVLGMLKRFAAGLAQDRIGYASTRRPERHHTL